MATGKSTKQPITKQFTIKKTRNNQQTYPVHQERNRCDFEKKCGKNLHRLLNLNLAAVE
jgi:hypothetical protein